MNTSIVKIGDSLLVTFPGDIGDAETIELQDAVNETIESTSASGLLLDISALEMVDSFLGRLINDISAGAKLLGAQTIVAGMQPAVAMTLVELGLNLRSVRTALDVERGLKMLGISVNGRQANDRR